MQITTKVQAKQAASALRRELKELNKAPSELKHNDVLAALAKALGYSSWNEWNASLSAEEAPKASAASEDGDYVSPYLLTNEGQFDFVAKGEEGSPFGPFFHRIEGTRELIPGTAGLMSAARTKGHDFDIQYDGNTDVHWDDQKTVKNQEGADIFVSAGDCDESGNRVVLLPEDYDGDPYSDEELPVREPLLKAFETYCIANGLVDQVAGLEDAASVKEVINETEAKLGFALTAKEEVELIHRMRKLQK